MKTESMEYSYRPTAAAFSCAAMNCHYVRYPLEYFLDAMQRFGFSQIELFAAMPHFFMDDVGDAEVETLLEGCRERGLSIVSLTPAQGVYPLSVSFDSEKPRRRTIALLKKGIETAHKLGAGSMLVSPGNGYETQSQDHVWGLCRDAMTELAEHAARYQITLMIEPLTPMTSNVINTSEQSAKMIREVNSPWLKSMMDIGVMNFMHETVEQYFDNLGENLAYIHFTDGPGAHVALGDGSFPMAEYARQIEERGFRGIRSFEINDKRYLKDPDAAMVKNIRWLQQNGYSD